MCVTADSTLIENAAHAMLMQVLGGTYLANYVETHNHSAPVAKLRHEWFITYASSDKVVVPAATACASQLTPQQLANYTQVSCSCSCCSAVAAGSVYIRGKPAASSTSAAS
jgi:hypothetical protein